MAETRGCSPGLDAAHSPREARSGGGRQGSVLAAAAEPRHRRGHSGLTVPGQTLGPPGAVCSRGVAAVRVGGSGLGGSAPVTAPTGAVWTGCAMASPSRTQILRRHPHAAQHRGVVKLLAHERAHCGADAERAEEQARRDRSRSRTRVCPRGVSSVPRGGARRKTKGSAPRRPQRGPWNAGRSAARRAGQHQVRGRPDRASRPGGRAPAGEAVPTPRQRARPGPRRAPAESIVDIPCGPARRREWPLDTGSIRPSGGAPARQD